MTAKPLGEVETYGAVLPVEFTVKNGHEVPVFLDRIEATAGRRREMMAFSWRESMYEAGQFDKKIRPLFHNGLLLPGQEVTFVVPWRVISGEDKLILTITPTTISDLSGSVMLPTGRSEPGPEWRMSDEDGLEAFRVARFPALTPESDAKARAVTWQKVPVRPEPTLAGAVVSLPAPVAPFDPKWSKNLRDRPEAWAFSPTLSGYVVRVRAGSYNLQKEDEVIPLPRTPFEFFEALDGAEKQTKLLRHSGDVTVVTKENVRQIFRDVLRANRQISFSDDRQRAAFEEKPW